MPPAADPSRRLQRPWRGALLLLLAAPLLHCRAALVPPTDPQTLIDRARPGEVVRLGPGRLEGALVIRKPLTLVGEGAERTVIAAGPALRVEAAPVVLEALSVEGGEGALVAAPGAQLVLRQVRLGAKGTLLSAEAGARVELSGVSFEGGSCALLLRGAQASVEGTTFVGALDTAVRMLESRVTLRRVRVRMADAAEQGVAIFGARSDLDASALVLEGGEQGLLLRGGRAQVDGLELHAARASGVGLIGAQARLSYVRLVGPFSHAAILASDKAELLLREGHVEQAGAAGVLAVRSQVVLDAVVVEGARADSGGDFGHGVMVEEGGARLDAVTVAGAEGAALYAAASAVQVHSLRAKQVAVGIAATHGARVIAADVRVERPAEVGTLCWGGSRIALTGASMQARLGGAACTGSTTTQDAASSVDAEHAQASCSDDEVERGWRQVLEK